jgi:hypothetical protein
MSINRSNNLILRILRVSFVCRNDIIPHLIEELIEFTGPFDLVAFELIIEETEKLCPKRLKVGNIKVLLADYFHEWLPPCFN